jgi:iron complex transport system ATP-binding protein
MIDVVNLSLRYPGTTTNAVTDVSFNAPRGRLTAIVGPNGSGKSTIVRALLGRLRPIAGMVTLDGIGVGAISRRNLARAVAIIPQREEPAFPITVRDYVALGRHPFQSPWRGLSALDEQHIRGALDRAGVSQFADRSTDELSGGEWQRTRIARALAQQGEALVLDEPTTFLDVAHEMSVFELASSLAAEGRAVLIVSHQINLVARFADTMVLLHRGRAAAAGSPREVMRGELLEAVYEWPLVITRDPAVGAPALLPLRRK